MALQGIFFSTHQGNDLSTVQSDGTIETRGKIRRSAPRGIVDAAIFIIHARIRRPAPQSIAKKLVSNADRSEAGLERLAIELRKAETARAAADVTKRFDTVLDEDGEKIGQLEIGMTNGEDGSSGARRLSHGVLSEGKELFCRKAAGAASSHQRNGSSGL